MDNKFNFNRFWKYFQYDLRNIYNETGMFLLIFALFPIIFYLIYIFFGTIFTKDLSVMFSQGFHMVHGPNHTLRLVLFIVMAVIFVMIYPSRSYGHITDKAKGSAWLMLPVSRAEKFTSMILNTLIVLPLAFMVVYLASDFLVCLIDKSCGTAIILTNLFGSDGMAGNKDIVMTGNGFLLLAVEIIEYASIFLLGALLFKKWKIIGTILWLFALGMVSSTVFGLSMFSFNPGNQGVWMENFLQNHADHLNFYINLIINIGLVICVGGCGLWSWFKIKRMQH